MGILMDISVFEGPAHEDAGTLWLFLFQQELPENNVSLFSMVSNRFGWKKIYKYMNILGPVHYPVVLESQK